MKNWQVSVYAQDYSHFIETALQAATLIPPSKPFFTLLLIKVDNPLILLTPRPNYPHCITIDLGIITVASRQEHTGCRSRTGLKAWLDIYEVSCQEMSITTQNSQIAQYFDLHLSIDRLITAYIPQFEARDWDCSYGIRAQCAGIYIEMTQFEYMLLLKLLDLNLLYDDHMERFIASDMAVSAAGESGIPFLSLDLELAKLSFLIKEESNPIAELIVCENSVKMVKFEDDFVRFDLSSCALQLYSAVNSDHSDVFPAHSLSPGRLPTIIGRSLGHSSVPVFEVHLDKSRNSNKDVQVKLRQIGLYMNLAVLLEVQNYFYYGIPEYRKERETPLDYLVKYRPNPEDIEGEAENQWFAPKIEFSLMVKQPIIVFPTAPGSRVLVSQGDLSFSYFREHEKELMSRSDEFLPSLRKVFRWTHLELFTLRSRDITLLTDLSSVEKRKIISPFTYEYMSILENMGRKAIKYTLTHATSQLSLILSFNDLTHFQQSYQYQSSALEERWTVIKVLETIQSLKWVDKGSIYARSEVVRQSLQLQRMRTSGVVEKQLNSSQSEGVFEEIQAKEEEFVPLDAYYNLPELRVIMINDCAGAYSPLLNAKVTLTRAFSSKTEKSEEVRIESDAQVKYYNPLADCWEPLVESLQTTFLYRYNRDVTPHRQFVISVCEDVPLNINLSEAMLVHLYKVVNLWQSIHRDPGQEVVELVSPFSIRNDFGSQVVIETAGKAPRKQVIEAGFTLPYEVELVGGRDFTMPEDAISLRLMQDTGEIDTLTGVSLKKVQCLTRFFSHQFQAYKVILDIALVETRKVLTVRSPVLFSNDTQVPIALYFPYRPRTLLSHCLPGKTCPVPFLYCEELIGLSGAESTDPVPVDLKVLMTAAGGYYMELIVDSNSYILYVQRDKQNRDKVTICILPPFRFRNLLPCAVVVGLSSPQAWVQTLRAKVAKGEIYDIHQFRTGQEVYLTLRLKDLSESEAVLVAARRAKDRAEVAVVRDIEGNELVIAVSYADSAGSREISVHVAVSVLNYTGLPLTFYYRKRGATRRIPLQDPGEAILCPPCTKLATELNGLRSAAFKIGAVGAHNIVTVRGNADLNGDFPLYQFVYDVEVAWPRAEELLYTRVVSISPRLIIVNQLKCYLVVIQSGVHRDPLILQPGDRSPFYWATGKRKELVQIRPVSTAIHYKNISKEFDMQWGWSGPIEITNMGTTIVQCKDLTTSSQYLLVKAEVRLVEFSALAIFEEEEEKYSSYRVENHSQAVSLGLFQVGCEEDRRYIDVLSSTSFGWTNPLLPRQVAVEFLRGTLARCPVFHVKYVFNFDQVNKTHYVKIKESAEMGHLLYILLHNVGSTLVLDISDSPLESLDAAEDQPLTVLNVNIPHLSFSIIEAKWPSVKELVYAHVTGTDFFYVRTEKLCGYTVSVQSMQVDNQYNQTPLYPVLMFQTSERGPKFELFHASIQQYIDENPSVKSFKEVKVALQSLSLNIESIMVQRLVSLYLRARRELASATSPGVPLIFQPFTSDKLKSPMWLTQELSRSHYKYYIEKVDLKAVKLVLSYATLNEEQEELREELLAILSARGMLVMNVDSVPLRFYSFEVENVNAGQKQIVQAVALHYKSQFKSELFKLIGYTDILGNPIGLFNNLGTGFIDLLYEPVQGMAQGPLEAGKGLVKGAGSFLKNSVSATFGTVSKLTGSVATGITALTQDKDTMLQRQRDRTAHNPKDVVEGLAYGVRSLALGFGRGIVGVVAEPYKGAKSDGFAGLLKGGLRGVSGLVVRPVAGVFDFTSKTAEGIKNTTHRFDGKQGAQRVRPPRVTYGLGHHIRAYNENDAEVVQFMSDLNAKKYRNLTFCYQVLTQDWEGGQVLLVLYQELFVAVYVLTRKVIWETERDQIDSVEASEVRHGVVVRRKPMHKKGNVSKLQFLATFTGQNQQQKTLKRLRRVYFSSPD